MAEDLGIGVVVAQGAQQVDERGLLGSRAGVGGLAVFIEASLVADADGVGVVAAGVGACHLLGSHGVGGTVLGDVPVVAATLVASGLVAGFQVVW